MGPNPALRGESICRAALLEMPRSHLVDALLESLSFSIDIALVEKALGQWQE